MKVLEVGGDGDYSAVLFEQKYDQDEYLDLWQKAWKSKGHVITFVNNDEDDDWEQEINIIAHEFEDTDPKFISFIQNEIQDYDDSKHHNFYVVVNKKETQNDNIKQPKSRPNSIHN